MSEKTNHTQHMTALHEEFDELFKAARMRHPGASKQLDVSGHIVPAEIIAFDLFQQLKEQISPEVKG